MTTFFRYLIAGGTAAGILFLVLIALVEWMHVYPPVASAIAYVIACILNYTLQYHWTFKTNGSHKVMLARYTVVTLITFGMNLFIFWILYEKFNVLYLISQVISTGVVTLINFIINKHYTFKSKNDICKA